MPFAVAVQAATNDGTPCIPSPHAREIVTLVEPRGTAIFDTRGAWIVFSIAPFGEDIRGVFMLSATATPETGDRGVQRLAVEGPYRVSGDAGAPSPPAALWIAHVSRPDVASRVSVTYSLDLWQTSSGARCSGPPTVYPIGDFRWVPNNGTGPFGMKPPA